MKTFIKILGLIVALVSLGLGFYLGTYPLMFIDINSIFFVVIPPAGIMFYIFGSKAFWIPSWDNMLRHCILNYWIKLTTLAAVISVITGVVNMLANISDLKQIGPGLAMVMLSILYALLLRLVIFEPLKAKGIEDRT